MKTAIFTICSCNYLAYALSLQKSVEAVEPGRPFFIFLADEMPERPVPTAATVIAVSELGLPDLQSMAFRYSVMEFNTAIKADCFLHLLTERGFEAAIYLDPDIQLFAPLSEVDAAFERGACAVLTPHILSPVPEGSYPGEAEILVSGVFNLGFAAFSAGDEALTFLKWWSGRLHAECYSAPERGLFVDQRFVDLAPSLIGDLHVIRHPGYNVAYWNLTNRCLENSEAGLLVDGRPLVFFHFSGVEAGHPALFSKHLGGQGAPPGAAIMALVEAYLDGLERNDHSVWKTVPYAFGRFRDGSGILPPMRRQPPAGGPDDWFHAPDLAYWNGPDPKTDQGGGAEITRLMRGFYDMRPDLWEAFPLSSQAGRYGFHAWFHTHGRKEFGLPDSVLTGGGRPSWVSRLKLKVARWVLRRT